MTKQRTNTVRTLTALVIAALSITACSSGPLTPARDSSGPSSTAAKDADALRVAVVADSEIPQPLVDGLAEQSSISIVSAAVHHGATMADLDPDVEAALAEKPDVLLYSGGTNDLPRGPFVMLGDLDKRLADYTKRFPCVVVAVPIFRYEQGSAEEVARRTAGTRLLEQRVNEAGAHVVSYLDVSMAVRASGREFFADGELGAMHPGIDAYPDLVEALREGLDHCKEPPAEK